MNTRTTGGASEQWNQRTWEDTASEAKDATRSRLGKSLVAGSTSTNIHNFFFFFYKKQLSDINSLSLQHMVSLQKEIEEQQVLMRWHRE